MQWLLCIVCVCVCELQLFTKDAFNSWWEKGVGHGASPTDLVATFTEFTARTIADAYTAFGPAGLVEVTFAVQAIFLLRWRLPCLRVSG